MRYAIAVYKIMMMTMNGSPSHGRGPALAHKISNRAITVLRICRDILDHALNGVAKVVEEERRLQNAIVTTKGKVYTVDWSKTCKN